MTTTIRRSTVALLASSLLLTIGRGATLPFMTIYLTRRFQLEVDVIGYALSVALVVGVIFSMGFGILADKFDQKTLYADRHRGVYRGLYRHPRGQ